MSAIAAALMMREAVPADASRLARLAQHAGGGWNEARFAGSLSGSARGWLMEAPASSPAGDPTLQEALRPSIAAAILAQPGPDDWEVLDLAVAPACRKQGLARQLLLQLTHAARSAGAGRLILEVREGNGRARHIYSVAGFREVARRKGYYAASANSPIEDAIVMALQL